MSKATPTPKRLAANILLMDLDIVDGYWTERWPNIPEEMHDEISEQMDKILKPLRKRLYNIAKDVNATEIGNF